MRQWIVAAALLAACRDDQEPIARCVLGPNTQPFAGALRADLMDEIRKDKHAALPDYFQYGTATAAFQVEAGIRDSDWTVWTDTAGRIRGGDKPADGPRQEEHVDADVQAMRDLGSNAYRFGIEWSRLFPTREQFLADPPAPDPDAFLYYDALLNKLVAAGIRPMLTLQHFTLPTWLQDGLVSPEFVPLITRFAEWAAGTYGDRIDYWITINEPSGIVGGGYVDGSFPPGHVLDFDGFKKAYANIVEAHARMYDAIALNDRQDADGDGAFALISYASHNRLFLPATPGREEDLRGAKRLRWIVNLAITEAVSCGNYDANFDEKLDAEHDRINDRTLKDRLDFIGVNYYGTATVVGFQVEPYLGLPQINSPGSGRPKTDLDWDIAPEGLLPVLSELAPYRLPIILTENGVADSKDVTRPRFLVDTFLTIQAALERGYDLRGYYHWSLIDNFEWALGLCPRLGLYGIDYTQPGKPRTPRGSAEVYKQIIANRGVPDGLLNAFSYGAPSLCVP